MSKRNQQIQISDGRKLGYAERGLSNGKPLFYFHGTPSSRVESNLFLNDDLLQSLNVRLIAVDRPGLGLSDFQPDRRFMDFPKDILEVADYLKIDRFSVLAYSGGGAYGEACALSIPDRLVRVGVVSGTAPFNLPGLTDGIPADNLRYFDLSRGKPWLARLMLKMMGTLSRFAPDKMIANALATLPEPDRETVSTPEFQAGFLSMIQEALRKETRGAQYDTFLMITEWDFRPQDIQFPVLLWHGEQDQNAPLAMGRFMANAIPNSEAKFYPNEGHLSLFKKYAEEIVRTLVQ